MVLTRPQAKLAFTHVLSTVLGQMPDSPLHQALIHTGHDDIMSLVTMTSEAIDSLMYLMDDGKVSPVIVGHRSLVRVFIDYVHFRHSSGNPIGDDWVGITDSDFDAFRISPEYISAHTSSPAFQTVSPMKTTPKTSTLESFRRGIKRDPTLFPTLKDEANNDKWHTKFFNQARSQGVEDVLDGNYKPSSKEEEELFAEKQKYVYSVLDDHVLTDEGKTIVRRHQQEADAQSVYRELKEHHLFSTKALMTSSDTLSYITTARLGNGTWKGTFSSFINHWIDQVRQYERQTPEEDHFSNGQKRIMLENAVASVDELRQVKSNADLDQTKTGKIITYDKYVTLLKSAAARYDQTNGKKPNARRALYSHELSDSYYGDDDPSSSSDDGSSFDIDTSLDAIMAFATEHSRNGTGRHNAVRLDNDTWGKLSHDARRTWNQLSSSDKATILGKSLPSPGSAPRTDKRQASQHDTRDLLMTYLHAIEEDKTEEPNDDPPNTQSDDDDTTSLLINKAKQSQPLTPGDIRRVLSSASKRPPGNDTLDIKTHEVIYSVSAHKRLSQQSLVDRGANGGVAGSDVRIIHKDQRCVDIQGIDNHQLNDVSIGTVGGVTMTQKGPVILVLHQYALYNKGTSIHAPGQLEWFKNSVDDKSIRVGGTQSITTLDGYVLPLDIVNGLPRLQLRPYTDDEWASLPHVIMTGENTWDPSVLDHSHDPDDDWYDAISTVQKDPGHNLFDEFGNYRYRVAVQSYEFLRERAERDDLDSVFARCVLHAYNNEQSFLDSREDIEPEPPPTNKPVDISSSKPDFDQLRPLFGWLSPDTIRKTLAVTTQYARLPAGTLLKRAFKSANPYFNVLRRHEAVACDFVYADTPAIDNGSDTAVIFVGRDTRVTDAYGVKNDREFVNTLEDNIRDRGAPDKLISDRAQVEISKSVLSILRALFISSWQSEPHQQQQNYAERQIQIIKTMVNRIMDRVGAPAYAWLLCLLYVCFLLNHTYNGTIRGVPLQHLTGQTIDISPLLRFHFWQRVYYLKPPQKNFSSESTEGYGRIVGISEHVGPIMTYKVFCEDTRKVIFRAQVRPLTPADPNFRASSVDGEQASNPSEFLKTRFDNLRPSAGDINGSPTPDSNPLDDLPPGDPLVELDDLIGRSFLTEPKEDGTRLRATVTRYVQDFESELQEEPARVKFVCKVGKEEAEEVFTYNQLMEYITRDEDAIVWRFKRITAHQGPLSPGHPDYTGSTYNVMVEWENGEITTEPLTNIAADDPVTCAVYARENDLLETPGWRRFKRLAKREKKLLRIVNQAKLRSFRRGIKYKYGFIVPNDYDHAKQLDATNKNDRWKKAVELEMSQLDEYSTFEDIGHAQDTRPPAGHKKIRVHLVFDVKHDGRHKARLVADGHLTEAPLESVYSGVVSLRGFRLVLFLAELNDLQMWSTDIGNAYLEARTCEKVYVIAGEEFGDRKGHILLIKKALYGLRTSGARWHDRFFDVMTELGFKPCRAEPDIWLRENDGVYEYIAVYVDDLALAMRNPEEFIRLLTDDYKFKLKGTGPISFHLGMDFYREDDGTLCIAPRKYIEKIIDNYKRLYGTPPKHAQAPLEKGDHPELDTSELLDQEGITQYQSLIGSLQWVISIGRFDISTAVMTLSGFRSAPRKGHLDRAKRIFGYLAKMRHAAIRIRTEEPDYSDAPDPQYDWSYSVYGDCKEDIPRDAPRPLGKYVTLTHYVDANLMHDISTGKSVTGILHLLNKTPMDWYCKKQATVETATYGSEMVAARTCVEQIIELRNTLRYLGVPIRDKSFMFGDNQSVVNSAMQVHSKLHKRHVLLSYHRVREAIASKMVLFFHIPGDINPADILSKHWGYSQIWTHLRPLLFWSGDTQEVVDAP